MTHVMSRRTFVRGSALAAGAGLFLVACGNAARSTGGGGSLVSTLNMGYANEPQTLDPLFAPGVNEFNVNVNVMDGLYTTNEKLVPVPMLALSSKQMDPLTWEFKLRTGVKFHNGEPFDATSVVASYARSQDKTLAVKNTWADQINLDHIEVLDPHTVRFHTTEPTPFMLARIANDHYMFPPDYIKTNSADTIARKPVGTGAYVFKEWAPGSHLTMEANPEYWGSPKPKIKTVVLQFIPDESTRIDNLKTGAVQLINYVDPASIGLIGSKSSMGVAKVQTGRRVYAGFNTKLDPVTDLKVRQAINYGTDVEQICKSILGGATTRMKTFAELAFANPAVKGYDYDPAKAKSLLKQAGMGGGVHLTWDVDNGSYLGSQQFPSAIAASLKKVGVDVTIKQIDKSVATSEQKARKTDQMYLRSNAAAYDPGVTFMILDPKHAGNATQWNDPQFLDLWHKLMTGGTPSQRLQWCKQAQVILMQQAPMLFLWREPSIYGLNTTKVTGFSAPADEHLRFATIGHPV